MVSYKIFTQYLEYVHTKIHQTSIKSRTKPNHQIPSRNLGKKKKMMTNHI